MTRKKGDRDKRFRGKQDANPPTNWSDKLSLVFLAPQGTGSHSEGDLNTMAKYLGRLHAPYQWYPSSNSQEKVLLTTISRQSRRLLEHYVSRNCKLRCCEWAPPIESGDYLVQNTPLRTFQSLIRNDNPGQDYRFYIVREGDVIFYVGQAGNPISRLCSRLDPFDRRADDAFGRFLRRQADCGVFTSWRVQLLTLQDCESLVVASFLLPEQDADIIRKEVIEKYCKGGTWALNQAERVLIWLYQPCLNNTYNPFPTPLQQSMLVIFQPARFSYRPWQEEIADLLPSGQI